MKLSKNSRARLKLMTSAEKATVRKAARNLFDFGIISPKKLDMIARNYK